MFKSYTARALLGFGALTILGGGTALAASPASSSLSAAVDPTRPTPRPGHDRAVGVIQSVAASTLVVERRHRAGKAAPGAAPAVDDRTFTLTSATRVVRWNARKTALGRDALRAGQRVAVRYVSDAGSSVARLVVILPDLRTGTVTERHDGGFTIRTAHGDLVHVTTSVATRYVQGRKGKQAGSAGAVSEGDRVVVAGTPQGSDGFSAARVRYWSARRGGAGAPSNATPTPAQ